MDLLKKNILSVVCGGVILLAIAALFWPLDGMMEEVKGRGTTRAALYDKLNRLITSNRTLPTVSLDSVEPKKLEQFPGERVIAAGKEATEAVSAQATGMQKAAVEMNFHKLLVENSLPAPENKDRFRFRERYRETLRTEIPTTVLQATIPPSEDEIQNERERIWNQVYVPKIIYRVEADPRGVEQRVALNLPLVQQKYIAEIQDLPAKMRHKRASQFKMYMDPDAISVSDAVISEGRTPTDAEIWHAQVALWIQHDVCSTIATLNSKSNSTLLSPIKRLIALRVAPDATQYVTAADLGAIRPPGEEAPPPADQQAALIERKYDRSASGRVCNPLYDVVRFSIEANVDARNIPQFIQELTRARKFSADGSSNGSSFINVNRLDLLSVDKGPALEEGYFYGEAPVVKITLDCEALFMRAWTSKLMPPDVKRTLAITPPAPGETPPPAAAPVFN